MCSFEKYNFWHYHGIQNILTSIMNDNASFDTVTTLKKKKFLTNINGYFNAYHKTFFFNKFFALKT